MENEEVNSLVAEANKGNLACKYRLTWENLFVEKYAWGSSPSWDYD